MALSPCTIVKRPRKGEKEKQKKRYGTCFAPFQAGGGGGGKSKRRREGKPPTRVLQKILY